MQKWGELMETDQPPSGADDAIRKGDLAEALLRFESLGDNCEFGFIQRWHGVEPGGLLRWSTTPLEALVKLLQTDFKEAYQFENLIPNPTASDMVIDTATKIGFHSKMSSRDGVFDGDVESRLAIYREEKSKVDHLVAKMRTNFEDGNTIFVYKATWGTPERQLMELLEAIRSRGDCKLLYVEIAPCSWDGERVTEQKSGLLVGKMTRFAPWESVDADHIDVEAWNQIVVAASKLSPINPQK